MSEGESQQMANHPLPEVVQPPPVVDAADPVRTAAVVATFQTEAADIPQPQPNNKEHQPTTDETTYVMCSEKDVLMGRGKRISEWPGNQKFRAIIARYRSQYLTSVRSAKIQVAQQVIAEVVADGGRFLRELDPGNTGIVAWSKWLPVDMDRCIEKTCQALREKEKTNKRKSESQTNDPVIVSYDAKKLKSHESDEELFQRLNSFRERHGHTAVPPGWAKDRDLADWTTVQRRLFRDLKNGIVVELRKPRAKHRTNFPDELGVFAEDEKREELILETNETLPAPGATITEQQQQLVDKLRGIDFCVDFEEWHWEHSFQLFLQGDSLKKRVWLRQQRRDHREGTLTEDRRVRLESAGVNWLIPMEARGLEL